MGWGTCLLSSDLVSETRGHVGACVRDPGASPVWLQHDLLVPSPAGARLAYFQLLAIMKKSAVAVGVKILVWACVFVPLGSLGMGLQVAGWLCVFRSIL